MPKFNETKFLSRNMGLISSKTQRKISKTRLLLIGVGLGSQIAVLAVRTGFRKFILCDGDKIEQNNLNRQAFDLKDIGKNKAEVMKEKLLAINPSCEVEVYPKFIKTKKEAKKLIEKSDIIINMADPEEILYQINDVAKKQNKSVIFPFTFDFGGLALIFLPDSATIEQIIGGRIFGNECFARLIMHSIGLLKNKTNLMNIYFRSIKKNGYVPQLGISTNITSSIIISAMIRLIEGKSVSQTPDSVIVNPWS